jgi:hypothetical protein
MNKLLLSLGLLCCIAAAPRTCTALGITSCCTSAAVNSTGVTALFGKLSIQVPQEHGSSLLLSLLLLLLLLLVRHACRSCSSLRPISAAQCISSCSAACSFHHNAPAQTQLEHIELL